MAMTITSKILATDFVNLKARVKAEMLRRNGTGTLAAYGAVGYDYTIAPTIGVVIKEEHYDKIRDLMANINSTTTALPALGVGSVVVAMNALEGNMTTFEAKPRAEMTTSDCSVSCTGMCITVCTTTCTGCTGTCTGGCDATCTGSCDDTCSAACASNCSGTCSASCADNCSGSCDTTCSGGCDYLCSGCQGGCQGCTDCTSACTDNGCSAVCGGCTSCTGSCSGTTKS